MMEEIKNQFKNLESRIDDILRQLEAQNQRIDELFTKVKSVQDATAPKQTALIEGNTNPTADSYQPFFHNIPNASNWIPIKGNVYVHDLNPEFIDVRSPNTNEPFQIIITE